MVKKGILVTLFASMVGMQLYFPASSIIQRELVIKNGTQFRFETAPIDPNDPFRGKYITLAFQIETQQIRDSMFWKSKDDIYVYIETNHEGFAVVDKITKTPEGDDPNYFKARIDYLSPGFLTIEFPFERYYMEESKAPEAERVYRDSRNNDKLEASALVYIKDGMSVLTGVEINGEPIEKYIE